MPGGCCCLHSSPPQPDLMACAGFECLSEDVADVMGLFSEVILQPALPQAKLDLFKSQASCGHAVPSAPAGQALQGVLKAAANGCMGTQVAGLHPLQASLEFLVACLAHGALSELGTDTDMRTGHTAGS